MTTALKLCVLESNPKNNLLMKILMPKKRELPTLSRLPRKFFGPVLKYLIHQNTDQHHGAQDGEV